MPPLPGPLWAHLWLQRKKKNLEVEAVCVAKRCCLLVTFCKCHSLHHLRQNQLN